MDVDAAAKTSLNEEAGFIESVSVDTLSYKHSNLYRYWMDTLRYGKETIVEANGQTATTGRYVVRTPEDIHTQFVVDVHRLGNMPINSRLPVAGVWKEATLLEEVRTSLGEAYPSWRERYLPVFDLIVSQTIQATSWGFYTKKVAPFGYIVRQGTENYKRLDIEPTGAFRFVWAQNWAIHSLADVADDKEDNVLMVIPDVTTVQFIPGEGSTFSGFFQCESNFGRQMDAMIRIADNFLVELSRRLPLPVTSVFGKPTSSSSPDYKTAMSRIALRILPAVTQRRLLTHLRLDESVLTTLDSILHLHGYYYISGKRVPIKAEDFRQLEDRIIDRYGRTYTHSTHAAIPYLLRIKETIDYMRTAPECATLERFLKLARNETTRGSNITSIGEKSIVTGPGFYKLHELLSPTLDVLRALFTIPAKAGGSRRRRRSKKQKTRRQRH
jgi:hypothetical protein